MGYREGEPDKKMMKSPGTEYEADKCPEYGTREYFKALGMSPEEYFSGDKGHYRAMAHQCHACAD